MKALDYFKDHHDYFLSQIGELIAFKSISTDPQFKDQLTQAQAWVTAKFESLGFSVDTVSTSSNPVLIASREEDPALPTVLLYGHYDVQPVEPVSDWASDPFAMTRRSDKLFARGIMDNKGQHMMHVSALEAMLKADGHLPVNVKFLIEGDEETGSADLAEVIRGHAEELRADFALISDGMIIGDDTPVIEASFRGIVNTRLTFFGPKEDMHSGEFGGSIANPAYELAKFLGQLYDDSYRVRLPDFYKEVRAISEAEKKATLERSSTEADFLTLTGVPSGQGEAGYSWLERSGLRPTLQITAFHAGYGGEGYKNVVPAKAAARLNFRLVCDQDPKAVYDSLEAFVAANAPKSITWELSRGDFVSAVKVDTTSPYFTQVGTVLKDVFHKKPEISFVGGTLPVVNAMQNCLKIPLLCVPLSQEDCGIHAPNEHLTLAAFNRGVEFSIAFLSSVRKPSASGEQ